MLTNRKITTYTDNIKDLSDTPSSDGITAEELKAKFDGRTDAEIKTNFNGLIDDLEAMEIEKLVVSDDIRHARLNGDKVIETSADGIAWEATGSSGHIIIDNNGTQLPQRGRLKFNTATITDSGTETVVTALQGDQGIQGEQGIQGIKGDKGDKGDTGYSIIPSVDQNTGLMSFVEGLAGVVPASVNVRGPQGPQGVQGLQGSIGPKGDQGIQGVKGDTGSQGPKGDKGDIGATGPQGSQGIKGDAGSQGPQGVQGIQGPIGPEGQRGLTGVQGPTGPQGLKGNNGIDGTSFMLKGLYATLYALQAAHPVGSVGDAYAVGTSTNNVIYNWDVDTVGWVSLGQLQGPQGSQGIQGIQGEQGIQGIKGDKGDKGDQGTQGIQGVQGEQGPNKVTTSTVTGINGILKGNGSVVSQALKADVTALSKPSGVRFVVGTSTAGWTAADCDYLCDGTADQTEINAAITALPATGGEIVILDGTYNITAKIDVTKDNVSIRGNGNATILKRMWDSPNITPRQGIIVVSAENCRIEKLFLDGNSATFNSTYNNGLYVRGNNNTIFGVTCKANYSGVNIGSGNNVITGCISTSNTGVGMVFSAAASAGNMVSGNVITSNGGNGISLDSSSVNNTITGNTCNSNYYGISVNAAAAHSNTITGNTCNNNNQGIHLGGSRNTITGNTCHDNSVHGIRVDDAAANIIVGNACMRGTGLAGDYTEAQNTINVYGTYNLISANICMGKAVAVLGTGNVEVNNKHS